MAGDPVVFKQEAQPGKMRHTFTGIRTTFPNLGLHAIIREMTRYRKELFKRTEFLAETAWDDQVLLFVHSAIDRIKKEVDEATYRTIFSEGTPLAERQKAYREFVEKATSKDTSVEALANEIESTHSDEMLTAARAVSHTISFDHTGVDPDYPQPTPARIPNEAARAVITGFDYLIVDMTQSNSADLPRAINQFEAAEFNAKLADLYKLASIRGGMDKLPHLPTSLDRSQLDNVWNADGAFDPLLSDAGPRAGEAPHTTSSP